VGGVEIEGIIRLQGKGRVEDEGLFENIPFALKGFSREEEKAGETKKRKSVVDMGKWARERFIED